MKKCPVCNQKMEHWFDVGHILLEEEFSCPRCKYFYYFGFGGYEVRVGNRWWQWSYLDDWKLTRQYDTEIAVEIIYYRCLKWLGMKGSF